MEEAKDFNKYTSKVNFAPLQILYFKMGNLPNIKKEISFVDKMNPAN